MAYLATEFAIGRVLVAEKLERFLARVLSREQEMWGGDGQLTLGCTTGQYRALIVLTIVFGGVRNNWPRIGTI